MGNVNVADINSYIKRSDANMANTMSVLQKSLVQVYGGFLRVRRENGKRYVDYVRDFGGINSQPIRFGENLLDMKKHLNPMKMITALIPRGAEIDDGGEEKKYVDVSGVNGGRDYVYEQEAVDAYGWIYGTKDFSDVTDPEILLAKSKAYLKESTVMPATITVNALDLSCVDVDIEKLKVGYWTDIISVPHNLSKRFMLSKRVINLMDPGKDVIVLGRTIETFTSAANKQQNALTDSVRRVADSASREIRRKVENATQLITGGKGGYVVLDMEDENGKRALPWRILIMDTPDKDTAKNVIQINQNGIGFSTTGMRGPYANAWTIDGNLIADFITTGTMLADRIRGGTLELGGTGIGRDGRLVVKDVDGKDIGYWDKTGLHVLRGIIDGTTIKGSDIIGSDITGGTIDIGNGTFTVDRHGDVNIESGEINIGDVLITDGYTWLGDFGISSTGDGLFYSRDSGNSVEIHSATSPLENGPVIILQRNGNQTRISSTGIRSGSVWCGDDIYFDDSWTEGMTLLEMLRDLYDRTKG